MNDFRYVGEECPVCGEVFNNEDDIVVCPLCGTPHHRECYKKNGECGNSDKHSEGFVWSAKEIDSEDTASLSEQLPEQQPQQQYTQMPPYAQGMPTPQFIQVQNPLNAFPPELGEGVATEDAAAYIKYNVPSYLGKFFTENTGKRTFNIAAFFLGGYWFICRKMYKLGAIFLAITLLLSAVPMFIPQCARLSNEVQELTESYQNIDVSENSIDEVNKLYDELFKTLKKYPVGVAIQVILYAAEIGLAVYMGFTANGKYKTHISKKIKGINKTAQTDELRKWRIINEGGRSVGMAFLSMFILYCLQAALILLSGLVIK